MKACYEGGLFNILTRCRANINITLILQIHINTTNTSYVLQAYKFCSFVQFTFSSFFPPFSLYRDFNFLRRASVVLYRRRKKPAREKKRLRGSIILSSSRMVILGSSRVARSEDGRFLADGILCFALRIAKRASYRPLWINKFYADLQQLPRRKSRSVCWRSYNWEKFSVYKMNVI